MNKSVYIIVVIVLLILGFVIWNNGKDSSDDNGLMPDDSGGMMEQDSMPASDSGATNGTSAIPSQRSGASSESSTQTTSSGTQTPTGVLTGRVLVRYTDEGFVPKTILILQGTVVEFVNQTSGKAMRVSAMPQESYGAFQQSKSVGSGGIFTFGFTKTGSFRYNNLNSVDDQGTVHVIKQP